MDMQQGNPTGQSATPAQRNIDEERKKLDADLKAGKISQAEYFKKMQDLQGGAPANPMLTPAGAAPQPVAGGGTANPQVPQLPPASGVQPITPVAPITPQQIGPKEEVPPIGQALAVSSEDVEVVECYKCGGLITITTSQRPVIIACPTCGTKGEVDASEPDIFPEEPAAPKPTDAKEIDEKKIFKFDDEEPKGPTFGASYEEDLKRQGLAEPQPASQPQVAPSPSVAGSPQAQPKLKKPE